MAEIKWNKLGECFFETDNADTNFTLVANTMSEAFGLTLDSEKSTTKYYKLGSVSNGGVAFVKYNETAKIEYLYYKKEDGTMSVIHSMGGTGNISLRKNYGARCYDVNIGGYHIYMLKHVVNGVNSNHAGAFSVESFTDYFSGQTCKVLFGDGARSGDNFGLLGTGYVYEKSADMYVRLDQVVIGGTNYPIEAKGITVATPVFFQNAYHYGYLGRSPNLYAIYPSIATHLKLGTQYQVNGKTFSYIGYQLFVRSD